MLAAVLIGFSSGLYVLADQYLHRQAQERLDAILNTLSAAAEVGPEGVEWEPNGRFQSFDAQVVVNQNVWMVADERSQVVDQSKTVDTGIFLKEITLQLESLKQNRTWRAGQWQAGQRWIRSEVSRANGEPDQANTVEVGTKHRVLSITAGVSLNPVRVTLRRLGNTLFVLSLAVWLVALFLGQIVCRRALHPVRQMAAVAGEMDADDLALRLPKIHSHDELEDLSRAFNGLLDRLQDAFERQRRFTGDASHQLRTPLTAILGQIEVALRRERSAREYQRVLVTVHDQAGHLSRIVEALLFLARADSESGLPTLEPLNLTTWLPQYLRTWSEHVRSDDLTLECDSFISCDIEAQPALLGELLTILLDNACKFSEPGTPVKVRLEQDENAVWLKVEDKGCGIAKNNLATLFVPFCRSDEARRRGIEGVGLGLSIARRLAGVFAATLSVVSQAGEGSCFVLRFSTPSKSNETG